MRTALVLALLPSLALANGPPSRFNDALVLKYDTYTLANGLTVILQEDHTVPVAAVYVLYRVGSKEEQPGKTGFAHLFEHLMFQGSKNVGDDQHLKIVEEAGGSANGSTNPDRTNYFETVPASYLERAIYLEADRMGFLLEALDLKKLDNQRDVVRNERRQRYENAPYMKALAPTVAALWPEGHPYHWLTIGSHEDLAAATLDDVRAFFRSYYLPANAVVAISGDFDPLQVRSWIETWFGSLPSGKPAPQAAPAPPAPLAADQRLKIEDNVKLPRLTLVWRSPAYYAPGDAELDMLAGVLARSKSSRLTRKLVLEKQWAQSVGAGQQSGMLGSSFQISVTAKPGRELAETEQVVLDELAAIAATPPTAEELARSRFGYEKGFLGALETSLGRAQLLSHYWHVLGRMDYLPEDLARYRNVTPEDVSRVAGQLLAQKKVVVEIWPAAPAKGGAK